MLAVTFYMHGKITNATAATRAKIINIVCSKQCSICERRTVDLTKPNGFSCTYCGSYSHSECSTIHFNSKVGLVFCLLR